MRRLANLLITVAIGCGSVCAQQGVPYNTQDAMQRPEYGRLDAVDEAPKAPEAPKASKAPRQKAPAPIASNKNKYIFRISSAKMCPGEYTDISVYIQQATPTQRTNAADPDLPFNIATIGSTGKSPITMIQTAIWFADTSVIEPVALTPGVFNSGGYVPVLPFIHPFITTHGMLSYNYVMKNDYFPGFSKLMLMWVYSPPSKDNIPAFVPDTNTPLFTFRVKMKKEGEASIYADTLWSWIMGGKYQEQFYYTQFLGTVEPNRSYDIPANIVQEDFSHAIPPTYKTYHIGGRITTAEKPVVYAGPDVDVCRSQRVSLEGATGGVGYSWSIIDGYDGITGSRNVQHPSFISPAPGVSRYRVKITDNYGCYSYDTMEVVVHPNLIETRMVHDSVIDSNTVFPLNAEVTSGNPAPYGLSYEPTSYIDGTATFSTQDDTLYVNAKTVPMETPTLLTATSTDKYCTREDPIVVNISGSTIRGNISNFPIIRCGEDSSETYTTLYLYTIGGSNMVTYKWRAVNMQIGVPDPEFITGDTVRNPYVKYYGQCCFSVEIYDAQTGKTVVISDTIDKVAPVIVDNFIERVGNDVICYGSSATFRADIKNAGCNPLLQWRINDRIVLESNNLADTLFEAVLSRDDTVSLVVYSSEVCAVNSPLLSNKIAPRVEFYSEMSSILGYGEGFLGKCDETKVVLSGLFRGMGNRFRLTWMRNNEVYTSNIILGQFESGGTVTQEVPRSNYYDEYSSMITEASTPCLLRDTSYSDIILVGLQSDAPLQVGVPVTYDDYTTETCNGVPATIYTSGLENVGESFILFWLKKSGGVIDTIGFYAYPKEGNGWLSEYPSSTWLNNLTNKGIPNLGVLYADYHQQYNPTPLLGNSPLNWFEKKFPLRINDNNTGIASNGKSDIINGDSIYYQISTVYHTGANCSTKVFNTVTSPKKAIIYFTAAPGAVNIVNANNITCENTPSIFFAQASNDGGMGRFTWLLNGIPIGNRGRMSPRGDTLYLSSGMSNGAILSCTANTKFPCATGFPVSNTYQATGLTQNPIVTIVGDTMVCDGDTAYVSLSSFSLSSIFVDMSASLAGLNGNPAPTAGESKSSLKFVPKVGGSYFYYRVRNVSTGCDYIDSSFVETRPDKNVKVVLSVDPIGKYGGGDTMVWCTSNDFLEFKFDAYFEDTHGHDSILDPSQYTYNWAFITPSDPYWTYYGGAKDRTQSRRYPEYGGNTVRIRIQDIKDVKTCKTEAIYSNSIHYLFLAPTTFSSQMQASYIFCDTMQSQIITAYMVDTVRTKYHYKWISETEGNIEGTNQSLDVSGFPAQKFFLNLFVQDRDSACSEINARINVTRGTYFPNHLYTNNSALDMDMFKVATGEKVVAPTFCPNEDSVLMKLVFRPYMRSNTSSDRYSITERPVSGTVGQRVVREIAPNDSVNVWFHRNFARAYIEHRIDTTGCASPDNYSWLEIYDPYGEAATQQIQPHAVYAKRDAVTEFAVGPDSSFCESNLAPVTITATGTAFAEGGFVWLPAAGLAISDTSLTSVVVNPTATTTYVGLLRLGQGCNQYDSATITVFSNISEVPKIHITSPAETIGGFFPLCGSVSDSFSLMINKTLSSVSTFKRTEWYINNTLVASFGGSLLENPRFQLHDGDSVYVKAYLLDDLKQCVTDTVFVSNTYKAKTIARPSITATNDTTVCEGNSVQLSFGGNGLAYLLYEGATRIDSNNLGSFMVTPSATTTYTVRSYVDFASCYASDSVRVTVTNGDRPMPGATITTNAPSEICGDTVVTYRLISCVSCDSLIWFAGGQRIDSGVSSITRTPSAGFDSVYIYAYRIQGAGCDVSAQAQSNIIVINMQPRPIIRISPRDTTVEEGESVTLTASGASNFAWGPAIHFSGAITGATVIAEPFSTAQIHVTGYNYIFCTGTDVITITVNPKAIDSSIVYVPNAVVLGSANPEDRIFTVKGPKVAGADIKILNSNGGIAFAENGIAAATPYVPVWHAEAAPMGNYNYRITVELTDGEIKTYRGWISVIK